MLDLTQAWPKAESRTVQEKVFGHLLSWRSVVVLGSDLFAGTAQIGCSPATTYLGHCRTTWTTISAPVLGTSACPLYPTNVAASSSISLCSAALSELSRGSTIHYRCCFSRVCTSKRNHAAALCCSYRAPQQAAVAIEKRRSRQS